MRGVRGAYAATVAWLTPAHVHGGHAPTVVAQCHGVMDAAFLQHPERLVTGPPRVSQLPTQVRINNAKDQTAVIG
ncbi:hypothetical protein [Gemmatimonas sp.]|uniref:hypothetical protein n=1 Tax=Gemmatimonas sp. TaxID=1962908 RepID=UPI0039836646